MVGVWWLWPTLTGADDDVDVLVVGDGMLAEARRSIELRVREEGLSVEWYEASDWCDDIGTLASVVDDTEPARVVVAFDDGPHVRRRRGDGDRRRRRRGGRGSGCRSRPARRWPRPGSTPSIRLA